MNIPDLVGDEGRVEIFASALRDLQLQLENLRVQQIINESGDDDQVAGLAQTYKGRREQIEAGIKRLVKENPAALKRLTDLAAESESA